MSTLRSILSVGLVMFACGCGDSGPSVGRVDGQVRMDGEPLPYAMVEFIADNGRPSIAATDGQGRYKLRYTKTTEGAIVGWHTARVSTHRAATGDMLDDDGKPLPPMPEKVDRRYNQNSRDNPDMRVEVKAGTNTIDLNVESRTP